MKSEANRSLLKSNHDSCNEAQLHIFLASLSEHGISTSSTR